MAGIRRLLDPTKMGLGAETLENDLRKRIVGQDEAIRQIVNIYQTFLAGMSSPGRPIGNLLFLGPTGSGKTRTVEAMAESLAGDAHAVIKIDCAEFQHSHEIAKLIGSPPGYLGHRETRPLLSQEALNQFQTEDLRVSFVLFDEIEKASDALWNLLLGILDKATLTLGDNRRVDFSRSIIFMTSNLGAAEMSAILRPKLGFSAGDSHDSASRAITAGQLSRASQEAARRKFTPEFMNRLDAVVAFNPLGDAELRKILDLEIEAVRERIAFATRASMTVTISDDAKELILREGIDARYGARHLRRAVERRLVSPMSNLIATGQLQDGDRVVVEVQESAPTRLIFMKEFEDAPPQVAESGLSATAA
jgi:ATP-dependent Clp protease ATP-binding subunit ClpB